MQRQLLNSRVEKEFDSDLGKLPLKRSSDSENSAHHSFCNIVTKAVHLLRVNYVI